VWGDSAWGRVIKATGLILFIGGPSIASIWETPGYFYLRAFDQPIISTPFRFGVLMAILVAVFWILVSAGRAYELAGAPELVVAEELELDFAHFRLKLLSKRKDLKTKVRLMDIVNSSLTPLVPGRFPLELEWTHHPGESDILLTVNFEESVSVATLRPKAFGWVDLAFTGARHEEEVTVSTGQSVYFLVSVQHPRKPIERWFRFERIGDVAFETFPESPPVLRLQANLTATKRDS